MTASTLAAADHVARQQPTFTGGFILRKSCGSFSFCPVVGRGHEALIEVEVGRRGEILRRAQLGYIRVSGNIFLDAVRFNRMDNPNKCVGVVRFDHEARTHSIVLVEQEIGQPSARLIPSDCILRVLGETTNGIARCRRVK